MPRKEYFWATLWAGIVLLLGGAIAVEHFVGGVDAGGGARPPATVAEARLLPPFVLPPEGQTPRDSVERPLFVPTRRPAPPAPAATASTMKRGQYVLTGVTITPEAAFAFLREVAGGKTHSVRKGTQLSGMTVETVEPRRVVLRQGEEAEDLRLAVLSPPKSAQAAAPVGPGSVPPAPGSMPGVPGVAPNPPKPSVPAPAAPASAGAAPPVPNAQAVPGAPTPRAPVSGRRRPWINAQ